MISDELIRVITEQRCIRSLFRRATFCEALCCSAALIRATRSQSVWRFIALSRARMCRLSYGKRVFPIGVLDRHGGRLDRQHFQALRALAAQVQHSFSIHEIIDEVLFDLLRRSRENRRLQAIREELINVDTHRNYSIEKDATLHFVPASAAAVTIQNAANSAPFLGSPESGLSRRMYMRMMNDQQQHTINAWKDHK